VTRFLARIDLRHGRRWVASILLLALAGGAALTAAQAARRTDTAYARALADGHASDAVVNANTYSPDPLKLGVQRAKGMRLLDAVDHLPMVIAHGRFGGANLFAFKGNELDQRFVTGSAFGLVAYDDAIGRTISTLRLSAGRPARLDRADEITINTKVAKLTGWRVGDRVHDLREYDPSELDPKTGAPDPEQGTRLSMRVVGVGDLPDELLMPPSDREPRVFLTPAFARRFPDSTFYLNEWVRLRRGHQDLAALPRRRRDGEPRCVRRRHADRADRRRARQGEPRQRSSGSGVVDPRRSGGDGRHPARSAGTGPVVRGTGE